MDKKKVGLEIKSPPSKAKGSGQPNTDPVSYLPLLDGASVDNCSYKALFSDRVELGISGDFTEGPTRAERDTSNGTEEREVGFDSVIEDKPIDKSKDFFSSYLSDLGSKALLSPEEEKALAKRIEQGRKIFRKIVLQSPVTINVVVRLGEKLKSGELRLQDVCQPHEKYYHVCEKQHLREICKTIDRIERLEQQTKQLLSRGNNNQRRFERAQGILGWVYELLVNLHLTDSRIQHIAEYLKSYAQRIEHSENEIKALFLHQEYEAAEQPQSLHQKRSIAPANKGVSRIYQVNTDLRTSLIRLKKDVKRLQEIEAEIQAAEKEFIEANLRLVISIAKKYTKYALPFPDLVQEGNIGLMHAVRRFDHRRGAKFSTYATFWIRQAIVRALLSQAKTIRIPSYVAESINKLMRASREFTRQHGRAPEMDEIAAEMGLPAEKIAALLNLTEMPLCLETPIGEDQKSQLADFIRDEKAVSPDQLAMERNQAKQLKKILNVLTPREEKIIRKRYGIGEEQDHTLEEVGQRMGVTKERIRQIEERTLKKLKRIYLREHLQAPSPVFMINAPTRD